ncbi:TRAP transporter small permease [Algihabitans albus]|uniref:TRAP transporter small permease n=1 Tax=Algihabitans albus TaxID=2164067 RepID=UPI000E5CC96D|nr:TRAP transporter small permease subunit [Algihabitans albus]
MTGDRPSGATLARLDDLLTRFARIVALLGMLGLGGAMAVTVVDVALRPTDSAIFGVVDLVQLGVMAAAWLAIPYAFLTDSHVSVDLLAQSLPSRLSALLRALGAGLAAGLMALILIYGWQAAAQQAQFGDVSQTLGLPKTWYWAPLLFGAALSLLATLLIAITALLAALQGADRGREQA